MLLSLTVKNYALIDSLKVEFDSGFTTITGETGAGKSILLGALGLVLGKRADLSSLKNPDQKCVIEAVFHIENYGLKSLFDQEDLDYEPHSILRREILPGGKSRAFVNDTPVTLETLKQLGDRLLDIHSQHQTLEITRSDFQFEVVDAMAANADLQESYRAHLRQFKKLSRELEALIQFKNEAVKELDYNTFLLEELRKAQLRLGMQEELEEQFERLSNTETIKEQLAYGAELLQAEQYGVLDQLNSLKSALSRIAPYGSQFKEFLERVSSVVIELDDLREEVVLAAEQLDDDPQALEQTRYQLQQIYDLQKKHATSEISGLLSIQEDLESKVGKTVAVDEEIALLENKIKEAQSSLDLSAQAIHVSRKEQLPVLQQRLEEILKDLGMPNARFQMELEYTQSYTPNGRDQLQFLFAANKGSEFQPLKKVASGGELSRIMLAVKAILANYMSLPTMMFDEIDTGVSGEIAEKMGEIMKGMSSRMQVFAITHLPQIAALGSSHFKVYKEDKGEATSSNMRRLSAEERLYAVAEMLSGSQLTEAALEHARNLMRQ